MRQNWVSLLGSVDLSNDEIALVPVEPPLFTPDTTPIVPHAIIRSNIEFEQGSISLEAYLPDPDSRCLIGIPVLKGGELYAGLNNHLGALYGIAIWRNSQWEPIAGSGHGGRIETKCWHKIALSVKGSTLDLYVDEVKVTSATQQIQKGPISLLLQSTARIVVRNIKIETNSPQCFVVMQFTEEYNALYREVIQPTCEAFHYKVIRADDTYTSGLIINDITRSIQDASIVIADITPDNPNVFYEVGFAHGIGKTTILLSDKKRKLPFDVSAFRTLFYDNTIAGKTEVEARLKKHLENIGATERSTDGFTSLRAPYLSNG
jgi:hypothetical protein